MQHIRQVVENTMNTAKQTGGVYRVYFDHDALLLCTTSATKGHTRGETICYVSPSGAYRDCCLTSEFRV